VDDVLVEFITESREGLDRLDGDFVQLEHTPDALHILAAVFRTIHTIKGTCGFFDLKTLQGVAHAGENLLVKLRDGELRLTSEMTSTLLDMVDAIRTLLDSVESEGVDRGDYAELIGELDAHVSGEREPEAPAPEPDLSACVNVTLFDDAPAVAPPITMPIAPPEARTCDNVIVFDDRQATVPADAPASCAGSVDAGTTPSNPPPDGDRATGKSGELWKVIRARLERTARELDDVTGGPGVAAHLVSVSRTVKACDNACGLLGFDKLGALGGECEKLLASLADGSVGMTPQASEALLSTVQAMLSMVQSIETHGHDGQDTFETLGQELSRLTQGTVPSPAIPSPAETQPAGTGSGAAGTNGSRAESAGPGTAPAGAGSPVETSVRVDVSLLDALMNQVGELVLARNQLVEYASRYEDSAFIASTQRLNQITSELQDGVMKTRMQPIHSIWAKLPRVVRDLSRSVGKQIRVEMEGKETELDKSLIEAMKDPLTHLIRNSVDHGIESPDARVARGKPPEGILLLRAYHQGGQVHIEIQDDGAGIDPDRICDKAVSKGLITSEQAALMSHADKCKLVFLPGLSTAEQVTNISGRGVGMDVVKTNIDAISGAIDLESVPGRGTTFKIRVPLTLAIVPALVVTSGGERFAIPQANLLELIRIDGSKDVLGVEMISDCPVYRLRGKLLPLVYLNEQLGLAQTRACTLNLVVLQAGNGRFGLVVDEINESQEIVVKPLAEVVRSVPVFAGATIMGDGCLALIVDVPGLAERAHVLSSQSQQELKRYDNDEETSDDARLSLLLVKSAGGGRVAIPLNDISRLEQFSVATLESVGDSQVVQYRGQILPLVELSDVLAERCEDGTDDGVRRVVVFGESGQQVGLLVREIVDVVDESLMIVGDSNRDGVLATAVIQEKVTEMLDVSYFLGSKQPADAAPRLCA